MTDAHDAPQGTLPDAWTAYIGPFAEILGKTVEDATELLKIIVGEPGDRAIILLKDAGLSPDADLKDLLAGTPLAIANQAISKLREVPVSHTPLAFGGADILPEVPSEESWLSSLRAGGQLKVDQPTVISVVRASLAHRVGLFDLPSILADKMEHFAEDNAEPVGEEYFKLRRQITRRDYGEIFAAIDGLDGKFISDKRRNDLLNRVDTIMWPALFDFHSQLKGWVESWQQGAANPAVLFGAITAMAGGGSAMPPGMMEPPDTGTVRDQAEAFNDSLNKVFAGTGIPVARALAFDAKGIKETLENPSLPAMVGAANREQMLRMLGVEVSAAYPRMETNLTKYVLAILQVKDLAAGNEELQFFGSLAMLGSQIPWDTLRERRGRS